MGGGSSKLRSKAFASGDSRTLTRRLKTRTARHRSDGSPWRANAEDASAQGELPCVARHAVRHLLEFAEARCGHGGEGRDEPKGGRAVHGPCRSPSRAEPRDRTEAPDRAVVARR